MEFPAELRYTSEHLWVREDGEDVITGVTDFAQDQLGDVVYVEMPDVGETVRAGKAFGLVESAKAVSDLFAPVSGEVIRRNEILDDQPEMVNASPYGDAWILAIRPSDRAELERLLSADAYKGEIAE